MDDIAGNLIHGATGGNAYSDIVPTPDPVNRTTLWLWIGTHSPSDKPAEITYPQYLTNLDAENKPVEFDKVIAHLEIIQNQAKEQIAVDRKLTLNPDPQGVLAGFVDQAVNKNSPESVTEEIADYLADLKKEWSDNREWFSSDTAFRDQIRLATNTGTKFQDALKTLRGNDISDADKISKLFEIMSLEEQDQIITARLRRIVGMDLEKRLRLGLLSNEDHLDTVIRLSTDSLASALTPGRPEGLARLKPGLFRGMQVAQANITNFFDEFNGSILEAFRRLNAQIKRLDEGPLGAARQVKAQLCILSLNSPEITEEFMKECKSVVLGQSENGNFTKNPNGDAIYISYREEAQKPIQKRFCSYRRFQNTLELQELLKQRPKRRLKD